LKTNYNLLTALLCGLVLFAGIASAAEKAKPKKLRGARGRKAETAVELTATGTKLEAKYTAMMNSLKTDITKELPTISDTKKTALLAALKAEAGPAKEVRAKAKEIGKIRGREGTLRNLQEQIKYAPAMVAAAEARLKRALALPDNDEGKAPELKIAQSKVKSRKKEADALPGRIEKAKVADAQMEKNLADGAKAYQAAVKAHTQVKAKTLKIVDKLNLDRVIASDKLDGKLAKYTILSEATPNDLAQFAQQGSTQKQLIEKLLSDTPLMIQMLVADGPFWEKYGRAMEIYTAIQKASPRAKEGLFQRLALATALVHAVPMIQGDAPIVKEKSMYVDPVKRYLSYEKWFLDGKLDPTFKNHSVWNLKMVVDEGTPNEIFAWGRDMMCSYRPDLVPADGNTTRYVDVVDAEITYSSKGVKNDKPEMHQQQNILANGGICGRRAGFGRFILRSFGVPTVARPEPGHATLAHWSPDGWKTRLGGQWGGRARIGRYGRDLNFLTNTQARENTAEYINVKRAQWIGDLKGEQSIYGRIIPKQKNNTPELGCWHAAALTEQQRIIDGLDSGKSLAAKNIEAVSPPIKIPAADRKIKIDGQGVITIPAVACSDPTSSTKQLFKGRFREGIVFMKSPIDGMQLYLSRYCTPSDTFEYTFDAPQAGTYQMSARVITPAPDQTLLVSANGTSKSEIALPYTMGLRDTTRPVAIKLVQGKNVLKFYGPARVTMKNFTLRPVK